MPRENAYTYPLRMPRSLREKLQKRADKEGISLNAYIVFVLTLDAAKEKD